MAQLLRQNNAPAQVLSSFFSPREALDLEEESAIFGAPINELGLDPGNINLDSFQYRLLENLITNVRNQIEHGLRERVSSAVGLIFNVVRDRVRPVLAQVLQVRERSYDLKNAELLSGWKAFFGQNIKDTSEHKDLEDVRRVIGIIDEVIDSLTQTLGDSFLNEPSEMPEDVNNMVLCVQELRSLKKRYEQWSPSARTNIEDQGFHNDYVDELKRISGRYSSVFPGRGCEEAELTRMNYCRGDVIVTTFDVIWDSYMEKRSRFVDSLDAGIGTLERQLAEYKKRKMVEYVEGL
ncbi:MAG: hypothetical protein WCX95_02565 [Candidatus Gracilibacteria bacterium]